MPFFRLKITYNHILSKSLHPVQTQLQIRIQQKLNMSGFGNNFPFGPNNSPFGPNFPFGPNSPFGPNFPFGASNPSGPRGGSQGGHCSEGAGDGGSGEKPSTASGEVSSGGSGGSLSGNKGGSSGGTAGDTGGHRGGSSSKYGQGGRHGRGSEHWSSGKRLKFNACVFQNYGQRCFLHDFTEAVRYISSPSPLFLKVLASSV